jgi:hypothetical protein
LLQAGLETCDTAGLEVCATLNRNGAAVPPYRKISKIFGWDLGCANVT